MKLTMKNIFVLFLMVLMTSQCFSQNIEGSWKGTLDLGLQKLALVFHFQKDNQGKYTCILDSPDQGAKGIPASIEYLSSDSVCVKIQNLDLSYTGKIQNDAIVGSLSQHGMTFPLHLKPGVVIRKRPQTPHPPFAYKTEDVSFINKEANAMLSGTLTYPVHYNEKKKIPVVLMVTGSGLQNRDEEIFDHKPFLVIADAFAKNGIATLRYDDRGFGKSTGDASKSTTADFAKDALSGIEKLKSMNKFSKIGVLGHSEGASVAFMLGAQHKVDFILSLAGVGVKGDTALTAQVNRISELYGQPSLLSVKQYRENVSKMNNVWLNYFINYDPASDIEKTACPVMAINGSKDSQVISSLNLPAIKKELPENHKDLIKEYPGMNHLFQVCTTGLPDEYVKIENTISVQVLEDMAHWINQL